MFDNFSNPQKHYFLFLCEGNSFDRFVLDSIKKAFFEDTNIEVVFLSYDTNIYQLYKEMQNEYYSDNINIFEFLKEKDILKGTNKIQDMLAENNIPDNVIFERIFLFFDYDGATCAQRKNNDSIPDDEIQKLLEYFDNETENGRLFISYPMCEAVIDFREACCKNNNGIFSEACLNSYCFFPAKDKYDQHNKTYKGIIGDLRFNYKKKTITDNEIKQQIIVFLNKLNCLLNGTYSLISKTDFDNTTSFMIHNKQREKYINTSGNIFILSAFVHFIVYYFGYEKILEKLKR